MSLNPKMGGSHSDCLIIVGRAYAGKSRLPDPLFGIRSITPVNDGKRLEIWLPAKGPFARERAP